MSLLENLQSQFPEQDRQQGATYFVTGAVKEVSDEDGLITAQVSNGEDSVNTVEMDTIDDHVIYMECGCLRFAAAGTCRHVWAAALQVSENRSTPPPRPSSYRSSKKKKVVSRKKRDKKKPKKKDKTPMWLKSLNEVARDFDDAGVTRQSVRPGAAREQRIWYVITLNRNLRNSSPLIEFEQQVQRQSGEWGSIKQLPISDPGISITDADHRDAIDTVNLWRRALKSDHGLDFYYRHRPEPQVVEWTIPSLAFDATLPKLFATGAVRWRLDDSTTAIESFPLRWDDEVWSLSIDVSTDEDAEEWIFQGRLNSPSNQTCLLEETAFVFMDGLVMFPNRMAKLDSNGLAQWLPMLRSTGKLRVPFADRDRFVKEFGDSNLLASLQLPEQLLPAAVDLKPAARIRLKTHQSGRTVRVHGVIHFLYGDVEIRVQESSLLLQSSESQVRYRRDINAETAWLKALPTDLRPYTDEPWQQNRPDVDCLPARMLTAVGGLLEAGWDVEIEEQKVRQGGIAKVSVSSEIDWFNLEGEFEFDDTAVVLPEILQAARAGQHFVKLRDGSLGMLPQEWLDNNEDLIALGEVSGEKIRFRQSQAMLLDSLLAAQDNGEADKRFKAFCRKLRSFDGIKPKSAPRGFKGELRQYQRDGLAWLNFLREFGLGGCLADDMGLGKTVQVLALLESRRTRRLKTDEQRLPSLVIVPKSLVFNWIEEARKFAPKLRVGNYTGTGRKSLLSSLDDYDILITTYGSARIDIVELKEIAFDYVILDESQAIKNSNAQAAKAVRLLNGRHRLAMTGTPIENHLGELWSLFEFLNPGMLGRSTAFKRLAKRPQSISKRDALADKSDNADATPDESKSKKPDGLEMLARAIRPYMLRRTKQEVLTDLPDKTEQTLFCELSGKQRKTYNEIRDFYRASLMQTVKKKGLKRSKFQVLEALLRLRQAACHPALISSDHVKTPSAKLDLLESQLEDITRDGRKVLVFSQFTSLLGLVRDRLDKQGTTYEYLDGKTTKRQQKVDRFQTDADCSVFLISLKAGGSGLNLTAAEYVFILDPWWNPAAEAQAIDRAHRIGQENQVFAYRLIAKDTIEERILELQDSKRDLAASIISADSSLMSGLSSEDLQMLLS